MIGENISLSFPQRGTSREHGLLELSVTGCGGGERELMPPARSIATAVVMGISRDRCRWYGASSLEKRIWEKY